MDELAVGRIGAPHGVDGRLKVISFSGETDHLLKLKTASLRMGERSLTVRITGSWPNGDNLLVKVEGYDSPEAARALTGYEIWVPRDKASRCAEDQYYYADLVGCSLVDGGKVYGTVAAVSDAGNGALLEVAMPSGPSVYVPFRKEFVGAVDVKAKRIELLAPWILE